MDSSSFAERVREHARTHYIEPARRRHEDKVEIVTGEIHRALQFENRFPIVCQALTGRKFLSENRLEIEKREGPPRGLGARVRITYRLLADAAEPSQSLPLLKLWGVGKDVFQSLGGGEAFIRRQREHFYEPDEDM